MRLSIEGWDEKSSWQTGKCLEDLELAEVKKQLEKAGRLIKTDE